VTEERGEEGGRKTRKTKEGEPRDCFTVEKEELKIPVENGKAKKWRLRRPQ